MKVGFISLGCAKNQVNCEQMIWQTYEAGHEVALGSEDCDAVVVNTCGFLQEARDEAMGEIEKLVEMKKAGQIQKIIVTGCMAQWKKDEMAELCPDVDGFIGVGGYEEIGQIINRIEEGETVSHFGDIHAPIPETDRVVCTSDYWAWLRIAEGCDNRCTYCAIPDIRGKFRSRPMDDLVREAKDLENLGVKELTIVAQDTTRYGIDLYGEYKLPELLRRLAKETKIEWFRLLYCYPDKITDELIAEMRDNDRVVKYIDLPLQHISDKVLHRMNRRGDSKMIRDVIGKLRREIPDIVIRTTFIVGFPGETEEDFEELCAFVDEAKFDRMGTFAYSREEGTPAYDFENQIDEQVKQDRADIIMSQQYRINAELNERFLHKTLKVLVEDYDVVAETYYGRSYMDAPEIDGKIYFSSKKKLKPGTFAQVKIDEIGDYDLLGHAL